MSKQFKDENTLLLNNFFKKTFFASWQLPLAERVKDPFKNLEIYLTTECNLGCSYCYLNRHEDSLYSKDIRDHETILNNLKMLLEWLAENKYVPEIELFSGAGVESDLGIKALELIAKHYSSIDKDLRINFLLIPTNFTYLLNKEYTERAHNVFKLLEEVGIKVGLSASIDGKYMETNRPFRNKKRVTTDMVMPDSNEDEDPRDDSYYDEVFKEVKKYFGGFHPMIYSKNIDKWKENFLWFQEMFKKHDIPFNWLYLLEIRNEEWTTKQVSEFMSFIEFLIDWIWEKFEHNKEKFTEFVLRDGFNILKASLGSRARGTTCSLQTTMYVRMGDLEIVPCHRQSYDGYSFGKFKVEDNKITGIEAKNVEMAVAMTTFDLATSPYCATCALKDVCVGGCMGAQLEVNGDSFMPIPTVCEMLHLKYLTIINKLRELGVYESHFRPRLNGKVGNTFDLLETLNSLVEKGE